MLVAVVAASAVMAALSAQAIVATADCRDHPVLANIAVTTDLAPSVQRIARVFNSQEHEVDGRCVVVQISPLPSPAAAAVIDGQHPAAGIPPIDAWIPNSSLWIDVAQSFPAGAQTVQPTGVSVARSPLLIVTPARAAARMPAFRRTSSWRLLLPRSAGGLAAPPALRVDLPDPGHSAIGLAALIEIGRLLGTTRTGRANFAQFVFQSTITSSFDDANSLESDFSLLAAPPLNSDPVTVTTEQAVLSYDSAYPAHPLAARYPDDGTRALGSPELDYPFVLTGTDRVRLDAASQFERALTGPYGAAVIRLAWFRSADGHPDVFPAAAGLSRQPLLAASPASASEVQTAIGEWHRLVLGARDLALVDVSAAMSRRGAPGAPSLEKLLTRTAALGLGLFPDSTSIGLWEFADSLSGTLPYKQLVPVGPLPGDVGLISRRQELLQIIASLQPIATRQVALYGTILAAYRYMESSWQPRDVNTLIVLTSGFENAPGDITASALVRRLRQLYNPGRPVGLVIIVLGKPTDFAALRQIAAVTGNSAYQITNPSQIGRVFFEAVSQRRICTPRCAVP